VDRARAPWAGWTIYHVMVEMFANGNPNNDGEIRDWKHPNYAGGDLQGVLEKTAYLQELGVNAVWLSPIFLSRTSHGYDVLNYYKIGDQFAVPDDPKASLELFRRLVKDLHGRGIQVILDLPLNHAHGAYERDETGDPGRLDPKATRARQEAEKLWESWGGSYRYWNLEHEPTRRFLKDVALHWLTQEGVDGLRLDYARGVPHDFWAELYAEVKKAKPEAFLVGEVWMDQGGPGGNAREIASYYEKVGGSPQFDSLLEFPLQSVATDVFARGNPALELEEMLQETEALYGPGVLPSRFLDNHDMARFLAWTGEPRRLTAAVGFLASLSGPAILFYGTETGLSHGGPKSGFTDASRIPMPWNSLDRGLGDAVRAILKARAAHPALTRGGRLPLLADKDSMVFAKVAPEETALVAVNLSNAPRTLDLDVSGLVPKGAKLTPVIGTAAAETAADTGRLRWVLPPLSTSAVIVASPVPL
ncbi:MAG TPA: alpha-amylase family glycosyl hydrolase, partial [Thermoanaerobaculia bacterium]|nr:alpha-amylase family glycosyl hydrolase [Thermoanaerobaculia bacterium]